MDKVVKRLKLSTFFLAINIIFMVVSYFLLNITNIIYFRHVILTGWIVHLLLALYVSFSLGKKSAFDEIKGKKGEEK